MKSLKYLEDHVYALIGLKLSKVFFFIFFLFVLNPQNCIDLSKWNNVFFLNFTTLLNHNRNIENEICSQIVNVCSMQSINSTIKRKILISSNFILKSLQNADKIIKYKCRTCFRILKNLFHDYFSIRFFSYFRLNIIVNHLSLLKLSIKQRRYIVFHIQESLFYIATYILRLSVKQ